MQHTKQIFLLIIFCEIIFSQNKVTNLQLPKNYKINLVEENKPKKNPQIAIALSLILPGSGEYYAGNLSDGKYNIITEVSLWLTYFGFNSYGNILKDDAREFAKINAGISLNRKNEKYFVDIGNYLNIDEYNNAKLLSGENNEIYWDVIYNWNWENDSQRKNYREMRIKSDEAFNNLKFVVGGIAVNHIISAINSFLLVKSFNEDIGLNLKFENLYLTNGFKISISKKL